MNRELAARQIEEEKKEAKAISNACPRIRPYLSSLKQSGGKIKRPNALVKRYHQHSIKNGKTSSVHCYKLPRVDPKSSGFRSTLLLLYPPNSGNAIIEQHCKVKGPADRSHQETKKSRRLIHVEVSFEDTLLEGVRLLPRRLGRRAHWRGDGRWRSWHVAHTLLAVMSGHLLCSRGGGRKAGTLGLRDRALSSRSKLLRPVEASAFTCTSRNGIVRCCSCF